MPLLPLPVLRIIEGLIAIVCLGGALACSLAWVLVMIAGPAELFGIWVTASGAFAAIVGFALGTIWFAVNAIRGGSTSIRSSR